jgi:heme/copper-type cytochrome/quinol oxidase subunit 2
MLSAVVEALNAIGVSCTANAAWLPEKTVALGHVLAKASLIIQIVVIALFAALATTFRQRYVKAGLTNRNVLGPITTLYISMVLILIHTVYRVVEYFSMTGTSVSADPESASPILGYEWYFWAFEGVLMLLNCYLWNARHPARVLPEDKNVYLARDGVSEVLGSGWEDRRPFLVTMMDPFGCCTAHKQMGKKEEWMTDRASSEEAEQNST